MTALSATDLLWGVWVISWLIASVWAKPVAARPSTAEELAHRAPTIAGYVLIFVGARVRLGGYDPLTVNRFWQTHGAGGWALAGVCLAGFAFTWWARISLGALWSGAVTRKMDHRVVESGPYRWVRHPIYTGLLLATAATAAEIATSAALAGLALVVIGFWLKARLEERFLSGELGAQAYEPYRRRTPMLIPFWPTSG